jgi:hypothetical protein
MHEFLCRIGLVAKPCDSSQNYFINLGEVSDPIIREDISKLYNLHMDMRFLCAFKAFREGDIAIPDNIEELFAIQKRYNITNKILINGVVEQKIMKLLSPELYDITCMVPLFTDKICRSIQQKGRKNPIVIFILFPYTDPIIRGKIIDNCFSILGDRESNFYVLGDRQGQNTISTCYLSRRYLLTCGIEDKDIILSKYDEFPGCILDAFNMIKFIFQAREMTTYICVSREDITNVMKYIRLAKKHTSIDTKVSLICD